MLAPTPTWPLDQGNRRRIHALGQAIRAAGAEVHFAHYPAEHDWRGEADARAHREMAAQWDGYFVIPPPGRSTRRHRLGPTTASTNGGTRRSPTSWIGSSRATAPMR